MVKWLRHRPFTAVTRVRLPFGSPPGVWRAPDLYQTFCSPFFSSKRGRSSPLAPKCGRCPMVGPLPSKQVFAGSSPVGRSNVDVMKLVDMAGSNPAGSNLSYGFESHHRHHSAMDLRVNCNEL